jgi:hypothetical protein
MSFMTFVGAFLLLISGNDGSEIEQKVPKINTRNTPAKGMNDMTLHSEALFQLELLPTLKRDVAGYTGQGPRAGPFNPQFFDRSFF